jgi:hypothetical protein
MLGRNPVAAVLFLVSLAIPASLAARTIEVRSDRDLRYALSIATPGTEIRIGTGRYRLNVYADKLQGTAEAPIVIYGANPASPPQFEGVRWQLVRPRHLTLRDITITNAGGESLNIDDGGSADEPATDVTLERIVIRDNTPQGNRDGIKLSGLDKFRIVDCQIAGWGTGGSGIDMVGCHNGVIERCRVKGNFAADANVGANGIQMKGGSSDIVVRRCSIENAGARGLNIGGSTGRAFFRPADANFEAKDITVEDCLIQGGLAAVAFVGVDGALVRHNTILFPRQQVIRILQETTEPNFVPSRNGQFERNLILFRDEELRELCNIGSNTAPQTFRFAENYWHNPSNPERTERFVRLPVAEVKPVFGPDPQGTLKDGVFSLAEGSPAEGYGVRPE